MLMSRAAQAPGFIAEGQQIAGVRIVLRMRGEGLAFDLAIEAVVAVQRFERVRIQRRRHGVFFHRQHAAVVVPDLGVLRAARQAAHAGIVGVGIAIHAIQRLARLVLRLPAIVLHPAAEVIHMAVLDAEHAGMSLAIEADVVVEAFGFRVLGIGTHAIEGAVEIVGQVAFDLAVVQRVLGAVDRDGKSIGRHAGCSTRPELAGLRGELDLCLGGSWKPVHRRHPVQQRWSGKCAGRRRKAGRCVYCGSSKSPFSCAFATGRYLL